MARPPRPAASGKGPKISSEKYPNGRLAAHTYENGSVGVATKERDQRSENRIPNTTHNRKKLITSALEEPQPSETSQKV
jgi:hypothetical protein